MHDSSKDNVTVGASVSAPTSSSSSSSSSSSLLPIDSQTAKKSAAGMRTSRRAPFGTDALIEAAKSAPPPVDDMVDGWLARGLRGRERYSSAVSSVSTDDERDGDDDEQHRGALFDDDDDDDDDTIDDDDDDLDSSESSDIEAEERVDEEMPTWGYLRDETASPELVPAMTSADNPATATDFVTVPWHLERMIVFGQLVCAESLFFTLTVLPIRFAIALYTFVAHRVRQGYFRLHHVQKIDILRLSLVALAFLFVRGIPIPALAKFIRRESLLKLKIMLTLLELMDRLLCSYGENILGSLYWAVNESPARVERGHVWHFVLAVVYIVLHSIFLLLQVSVLDVAVNSKNSTLMTLLILVQFAEMKGGVLKNISKQRLQKMCCDDIVERFQLLVNLSLLVVHNLFERKAAVAADDDGSGGGGDWRIFYAIAFVYASEIAVDWLKHTSIINFTRLPPTSYRDCSAFFAALLVRWPPRSWLTHASACLSPELGDLPLPLTAVALKMVVDWLQSTSVPLLLSVPALYIGTLALALVNRRLIVLVARSFHDNNLDSAIQVAQNGEPIPVGK
jgi:transmembrane anterior posterior transformation protein 1